MPRQKAIYLDHSASTPPDPRVIEAMLPYFTNIYGNSSSAHQFGRQAESAIESARETVAQILNCKPKEIVFTSGGSESDNLAIRGAALMQRERGKHLLTTPTEHEAVGQTIRQLAAFHDFSYTLLPVDKYGICQSEDFENAIRADTTAVSVIYANNEVGSIQPIADLAEHAHQHGLLIHTDAVQAAGQLSLDVRELSVDMLSISAHKFYGPKGVGALYIRDGLELVAHNTGGSHESGRRAGTHNTPLIVGLAKALEIAYNEAEIHLEHYCHMRNYLIHAVTQRVPMAQLTGHPEQRLPSHASFVIPGIDSGTLLIHLDVNGIAASGGSACKTGNPEPSEVLLALGYSKREAIGGLRLTVGRQTTLEDIDCAVDVLAHTVEKLHNMRNVR
jgi:cysteine desulfurase